MSAKRPRGPLCAGCAHFHVTAGAFKYTCLLWGVSSARYDIAQLIRESTGAPCPYCEPMRRGAKGDVPDAPGKPPAHDGAVDVRV